MKYDWRVTGLLVGLFLLAQVVGLAFISQDLQVVQTPQGPSLEHPPTALGDRPDVEGQDTVVLVLTGVLIGTALLLAIIKLAKVFLWRIMFFLAVLMTSWIALGVFFSLEIAFVTALVLTILKIYRSNIVTHNVTELLIYTGIAVLFVPILDVFWATVLLLVISAYDAFAVWQSRHMITLAKFQTDSKLFAGLFIDSGKPSRKAMPGKGSRKSGGSPSGGQAILGGGDIAFPLVFAGVVMESLVASGVGKGLAFFQVLIIPIVLSLVLLALLFKAEQGKFYPAMPFLTAGCLIGFGLVSLL